MHEDLIAASIAAAALVLLGILFTTGRGAGLIAGYNTLPEKERERFDKRALCRFMGKCMFFFAGCVALIGADHLRPGRRLALAGGIGLALGVVSCWSMPIRKGVF